MGTVSCQFMCLNTLSPVGGAVWEGYRSLRRWNYVTGGDFEESQFYFMVSFLLLLPVNG